MSETTITAEPEITEDIMSDEYQDALSRLRTRSSAIRDVALGETRIERRFQRRLNPKAVLKIKDGYHPQGIGTILVARMPSAEFPAQPYAVIDGQTRIVALNELHSDIASGRRENVPGLPDVITIRAEVFDDLTEQEAAVLFQLRNQQMPVPPKDRDWVAVAAGDVTMREVVAQAEEAGFTVFSDDPDEPPTMPHTDVGKRIVGWGGKYKRTGLLCEALLVQANAFGTGLGSVDKQVLAASADLMLHNDNINNDELSRVLATVGLAGLRAQAEATQATGYGRMNKSLRFVIMQAYNKGGKRQTEKIHV